MTPFAADAVEAIQHFAVNDDPAAYAGAEDGAEHHRGALCRTVARFGERKAVRVVREADFAPEFRLKIVLQAPTVERRVVRVHHAAAPRGDRSGHADTDRATSAAFLFGLRDERREFIERDVVARARRGRTAAHEF